MRLKDKIAVVTGGGSGLGAGICEELAKEGAKVAVLDLRLEAAEKTAEAIRGLGGTAKAYAVDVQLRKSMEDAAEDVKQVWGLIDIWVNSAGISKIKPFLDHTDELWDLTMNVNLKGTFYGCQTAVRQMLQKGGGSIINMASQSGRNGNSHFQAYCASKFGVVGLTQSVAVEFARQGIRVNAICPGVVFTPMWDEQMVDYAHKRNMKPGEVKPYFESKIPMGRLGEVLDIARTAVFLASEDSSYITGQCISLTGGTLML